MACSTGRRPAVVAACLLNLLLSFLLAAAPNITVYIILKVAIETLQVLYYIGTFVTGEMAENTVSISLSNFLM